MKKLDVVVGTLFPLLLQMKKIFFVVFLSLISLPVFGAVPVTKFDSINSSISCQIDISPLNIKTINGYEVVEALDCHQSAEVGKPELPRRSFFVLLPPNTTVKDITITQIDQIKLAGKYNIKPVFPPLPISKGAKVSQLLLPSEDFYPEKILEVSSIQKLRGYSLVCLSVFGACYNPKTKELTWNKHINFNLNLTFLNTEHRTPNTKYQTPSIRGLKEDEELVKGIVVNPELVDTYASVKKTTPLTKYVYLIITTDDLQSSFIPLCDSKPMTTIVTTSWIYSHYDGVDNQEKIKAFIKKYSENYETCYVLLGGDVDKVPYRRVYAKVIEDSYPIEDSNIPCDLYYACFDNDWDWDTDENGIYAECGTDTIDLLPEVFIGRAPVSNPSEAENFVNKVINFKNSYNDYIHNELLIGYILWPSPLCDAKDIMEEIANYIPATYTVHKEYESKGGVSISRITDYINSGVGVIAHANHTEWNTAPPFEIGRTIDVKTLSNGSKTFIFNTIGCIAGDFSKTDCIGEEMILNPHGGAVAFIGNSRYGWFEETDVKKYSGEYQIEFFKKLFKEGDTSIGETLAVAKMGLISECGTHTPYRWIMFCLNLLGDPAMEFRVAKEIFCIGQTIDQVIDKPGEIVDLVVTLKNLKDGTITGVNGRLTTTDPFITLIKSTASFGDMPSQSTATNSNNPYQIVVNSNSPLVHKANFSLKISGDGGYEYIDNFGVEINLHVENLDKVIHYPNPCYPDEGEVVKIANIPLNSNPKVYIYNLAGELIRILDDEFQKYPASEVAIWDGKNEEGKKVASGVYIYILKCDVGTKKGKIAIIR